MQCGSARSGALVSAGTGLFSWDFELTSNPIYLQIWQLTEQVLVEKEVKWVTKFCLAGCCAPPKGPLDPMVKTPFVFSKVTSERQQP